LNRRTEEAFQDYLKKEKARLASEEKTTSLREWMRRAFSAGVNHARSEK
jgi:hypothetical protein